MDFLEPVEHRDLRAAIGAVTDTYGRRLDLLLAGALRLAGWAAGAGETWLVMVFLGRPLSLTDAFILESLSSGVRAAAFMVPGALGALEGGIVVFGALFGLPADMALAISLSKRVRELALGLPGLVVALFGSTLTSDLSADRPTGASVDPKRVPRSAFEVMAPPLWLMRSD